MKYDFFEKEWYGKCSACNTELVFHTRKQYIKQRMTHIKSIECLGGW
jgi:transcription initiation factor IIE alpha subunit